MTKKHNSEPLLRISNSKTNRDESEDKRICFGCQSGDLFLWTDKTEQELKSFQLTYYANGDNRREFIIDWDGAQIRTGTVDSKEVGSRTHDLRSPIVQFFGTVDKRIVDGGMRFLGEHKIDLPVPLSQRILQILRS